MSKNEINKIIDKVAALTVDGLRLAEYRSSGAERFILMDAITAANLIKRDLRKMAEQNPDKFLEWAKEAYGVCP